MTSGVDDAERCNGIVLNTDDPVDDNLLHELRADARIEFIDNVHQQQAGLQRLRPPPQPDVSAEPIRSVYYPWRRTVVSVLGPRAIRLFRLDRNRNLITAAELERLGRLRIGVVGLSVGHAIDGEKLARTVSIDVALGVPGRDTTSDLLRRADAAALTAKNAGSNKVAVFSDDMSLKSEFRAAPCAWRSPKAWSYRTSRPHG